MAPFRRSPPFSHQWSHDPKESVESLQAFGALGEVVLQRPQGIAFKSPLDETPAIGFPGPKSNTLTVSANGWLTGLGNHHQAIAAIGISGENVI